MSTASISAAPLLAGPTAVDRLLGASLGALFTFGLFFGLAHLENVDPPTAAPEIVELRALALPLDAPPPPPQPTEVVNTPVEAPAFAGLEVGASDSAVRITVVPRDLEALLPSTREPPRALVKPGFVHSDLKPRIETQLEAKRIYQVSEVDQPPQAIVREPPSVPKEIFGPKATLRVVLLFIVNPDGTVSNLRVARTSGAPIFDRAAMETVKALWEFTPAIRRGQKVKCLVQQSVSLTRGGGNPFETR